MIERLGESLYGQCDCIAVYPSCVTVFSPNISYIYLYAIVELWSGRIN
jgi:hypothetical protein